MITPYYMSLPFVEDENRYNAPPDEDHTPHEEEYDGDTFPDPQTPTLLGSTAEHNAGGDTLSQQTDTP